MCQQRVEILNRFNQVSFGKCQIVACQNPLWQYDKQIVVIDNKFTMSTWLIDMLTTNWYDAKWLQAFLITTRGHVGIMVKLSQHG